MAEERISWFPVLPDDELEEPERKLFAKAAAVVGFVPNVFRTYAWRPERFRAWFAHFKTVMEGTPGLSAREREMISVAVSMANGCLYCLVAHGAALRETSDDKIEADRITLDYRRADLTSRERAILDYAVKVTKDAGGLRGVRHRGLTGRGPERRGRLGRRGSGRHVQLHQPAGHGHRHDAQPGVPRPGPLT